MSVHQLPSPDATPNKCIRRAKLYVVKKVDERQGKIRCKNEHHHQFARTTITVLQPVTPTRPPPPPPKPPTSPKPFVCPEPDCPWSYDSKTSLGRHRRGFHGIVLSRGRKRGGKRECKFEGCNYSCNSSDTMTRHVTQKHREDAQLKKETEGKLTCGLCDRNVSTYEILLEHLSTPHRDQLGVDFDVKERKFDSEEQFSIWKKELERGELADEDSKRCLFIKTSGARRTKFGVKVHYYQCHRSGAYEMAARLRGPRRKGSSKIGFTCSAFMRVYVYETGEVRVRYCPKHYGHEDSLEHLPVLTPESKEQVSQWFMEGMSERRILERLSDQFYASGGAARAPHRKIDLKDLKNFKQRLNLPPDIEINSDEEEERKEQELEEELRAKLKTVRGILRKGSLEDKRTALRLIEPLYVFASELAPNPPRIRRKSNGFRNRHSSVTRQAVERRRTISSSSDESEEVQVVDMEETLESVTQVQRFYCSSCMTVVVGDWVQCHKCANCYHNSPDCIDQVVHNPEEERWQCFLCMERR